MIKLLVFLGKNDDPLSCWCQVQTTLRNVSLQKNIQNSNFHCNIWFQHEKCIQMSTNKRRIGTVVLEVATRILRTLSNFNFFAQNSVQSNINPFNACVRMQTHAEIFNLKKSKINFFIAIWFQHKQCIQMNTNKPCIGAVVFEIAPARIWTKQSQFFTFEH